MGLINVEIILLVVIVVLSYLLPVSLWLFHLLDRFRLSKINSIDEYKKIVWFAKKSKITMREIKEVLISKEEKVKRRLSILFKITLPSLCFCFNVILLDDLGNYYIKKKFGYDVPTNFITHFIQTFTLILLSVWSSTVLRNKLLIYRISDFLKKADELEASFAGK